MGTKLGYPVWDADNHLYEAVDAYTRHLPKRYEGAIRFVDVNGRGVDMATMKKAMDQVDLAKLESMKDAGAKK